MSYTSCRYLPTIHGWRVKDMIAINLTGMVASWFIIFFGIQSRSGWTIAIGLALNFVELMFLVGM